MDKIEKKLRKRGMQKLDKFAHNPYHVDKPSFFSKIPLWGKIAIPASLVTAVTVVAFFGLINGLGAKAPQAPSKNDNETSHKAPAGSTSETKSTPQTSLSGDKGGNQGQGEGSVPGEADSFVFAEKKFELLYCYGLGDAIVAEGGVGNLIGEVVINEGKSNEQTASVYEINNYSPNVALALKFVNNQNYYSYFNTEATFTTIDDLLTQAPLMSDSYVSKGQMNLIEVHQYMYQIPDSSATTVNSIIFEDTNIPNTASTFTPDNNQRYITWDYGTITLGGECLKATLYESGHLVIKPRIGTGLNVYQIGAEKFDSLRSYVIGLPLLK